MDKTNVLNRLTFCGECVFWHPLDTKIIKEEYRGFIGYCDRPHQDKVERNANDFCSRGLNKED